MKTARTGSDSESKLTQNVELGTLCAFYGGLLTEKQRDALMLHYDEDLSLGEIAEQMQVSRQNVHDLITRSAQKLIRWEEAVGGVKQARHVGERLKNAMKTLEGVETLIADETALAGLKAARIELEQAAQEIDGEEDVAHGI